MVSLLMITGACYLTKDAFDDWEKYPISTVTYVKTIDKLIDDGKFPLIVVCPPEV